MRILIVLPGVPYPISSGGNCVQFTLLDELRHRHEIHLTFPTGSVAEENGVGELRRLLPEVRFHPYHAGRKNHGGALRALERFFRRRRDALRARGESPAQFLARKRARRLGQLRAELPPIDAGWREHVIRLEAGLRCDLTQVDYIENIGLGASLHGSARKLFVEIELGYVRLAREYRALGANETEAARQSAALASAECAALRAYDGVVTLSEDDRVQLDPQLKGEIPVWSCPPGMRREAVSLAPSLKPARKLVFVGGEGHFPNLDAVGWLVENVWPALHARHPQLKLLVTGEWRADTCRVLGRIPGVEFPGFVPDLASVLAEAVLVAPIRIGSGVRIKLLQGAALGLPMISTTIGAEGLGLQPEEEFLRADTPQEWTAAVERLLGDPALGARLAGAARTRVTGQFTSDYCAGRREEIYRKVLVGKPVRRD